MFRLSTPTFARFTPALFAGLRTTQPFFDAAATSGAPTHPYAKALTVSPRCFANISRINKIENVTNDKRFLRLAIESGGCQGFSYKFYFDDELDPEEDIKFEISNAAAPGLGGASPTNIPSSAEPSSTSSSSAATAAADASEPFVVADKSTLTKMQGAVIDYHTELKGSAFVVIGNEFVDHSCACAQSFSLRK